MQPSVDKANGLSPPYSPFLSESHIFPSSALQPPSAGNTLFTSQHHPPVSLTRPHTPLATRQPQALANMALPMSINSKDSITAETIAAHLNHEPGLPAAEDLDVDLVKQWIVALDIKLRSKEIKRLAPKVLDELRNMDGITADQAARHQQRYPIKRDTPKTIYTWNGDGSLSAKKDTPPESSDKQPSAWGVVGKKRNSKAILKEEVNDGTVTVKLEEGTSEQVVDDAITKAKAKKEKKAAKKARKLAQALKNAKPPVGPKQDDSEGSGNDSDWSQTSWSPSWASDSE